MNRRARAAVALQKQEVGRLKAQGGEPFKAAIARLQALELELRNAQKTRSENCNNNNASSVPLLDPNYPAAREIPTDAHGFTQAFSVETAASEASAFLAEWGFVVFENVLEPEEAAATVNEIWSELERTTPDLDRLNIDTYGCLQLVHGLAPSTPQYTPQVVSNRQNARLAEA